MRRVWAALVRLRVTIGYAVALVAVAVVLVIEGPRMQDRVVAHAVPTCTISTKGIWAPSSAAHS